LLGSDKSPRSCERIEHHAESCRVEEDLKRDRAAATMEDVTVVAGVRTAADRANTARAGANELRGEARMVSVPSIEAGGISVNADRVVSELESIKLRAHFELKCQHRIKVQAIRNERGSWYLEFGSEPDRDTAFRKVDGTFFAWANKIATFKLTRCNREREEQMEEDTAKPQATAPGGESDEVQLVAAVTRQEARSTAKRAVTDLTAGHRPDGQPAASAGRASKKRAVQAAPARQHTLLTVETGPASASAELRRDCVVEAWRSVEADGASTASSTKPAVELDAADLDTSEKDAKLAEKLGQLQPFMAVFPQECVGQLASFGPT
jgi:hypothetical protein